MRGQNPYDYAPTNMLARTTLDPEPGRIAASATPPSQRQHTSATATFPRNAQHTPNAKTRQQPERPFIGTPQSALTPSIACQPCTPPCASQASWAPFPHPPSRQRQSTRMDCQELSACRDKQSSPNLRCRKVPMRCSKTAAHLAKKHLYAQLSAE